MICTKIRRPGNELLDRLLGPPALGVLLPKAKGPTGAGGPNNLSNSSLEGFSTPCHFLMIFMSLFTSHFIFTFAIFHGDLEIMNYDPVRFH